MASLACLSGGRRGAGALWTLAALALNACADGVSAPADARVQSPAVNSPATADRSGGERDDRDDHDRRGGAVYTLTNAASGNGVIAFRRAVDGSLTGIGTYGT